MLWRIVADYIRKPKEKRVSRVLRRVSGAIAAEVSASKHSDSAGEVPGGHEEGYPDELGGDIGNMMHTGKAASERTSGICRLSQ